MYAPMMMIPAAPPVVFVSVNLYELADFEKEIPSVALAPNAHFAEFQYSTIEASKMPERRIAK